MRKLPLLLLAGLLVVAVSCSSSKKSATTTSTSTSTTTKAASSDPQVKQVCDATKRVHRTGEEPRVVEGRAARQTAAKLKAIATQIQHQSRRPPSRSDAKADLLPMLNQTAAKVGVGQLLRQQADSAIPRWRSALSNVRNLDIAAFSRWRSGRTARRWPPAAYGRLA